jgi:hypothetical protein
VCFAPLFEKWSSLYDNKFATFYEREISEYDRRIENATFCVDAITSGVSKGYVISAANDKNDTNIFLHVLFCSTFQKVVFFSTCCFAPLFKKWCFSPRVVLLHFSKSGIQKVVFKKWYSLLTILECHRFPSAHITRVQMEFDETPNYERFIEMMN